MGISRDRYSFLALKTPANREQFIKLLINSIVKHKLDGLNLMWQDAFHENNADLLSAISVHIKAHHLLLTASFPMENSRKFDQFNYAAIAPHVDFMQIFNTKSLIKAINSGAPRQKIIFGITTKAAFVVSDLVDLFDVNTYMYSLRYDEVCQLLSTNKVLSKTLDPESEKMLVRYIDQSGASHALTFESTRTVANKTRFAVKQNLGGVGLYLVDGDDAYGKCSIELDCYVDFEAPTGVILNIPMRRNNMFPLLQTINEAIFITIDELHQHYALMNKAKLANAKANANANANAKANANANANANTNANESTSNAIDWMQILNSLTN